MSAPKHMHGAILEALPASCAGALEAPRCVTEFDVNARDYGTGIKAHEFLETEETLRTKVKLLKKIAGTGRTVCATIHQPSSSVFGLFVSKRLLLLCSLSRTEFCFPP